jgi:hypothetical protein
MEIGGSGIIVYIPLLNNDQITVTLYQVNMISADGALLNTGVYTLPQPSSNLAVSIADS